MNPIMQHESHTLPAGVAPEGLTQKQRRVLALVAQGFDRESIARQLAIRGRMLRYHLAIIYEKTNVPSFHSLQAKVGVLQTLTLPDGRLILGAVPRKTPRM